MSDTLDNCRWVPPSEHDEDIDGHIIICENGDCDWWGTAYGSQFVIHATRHHGDTDE